MYLITMGYGSPSIITQGYYVFYEQVLDYICLNSEILTGLAIDSEVLFEFNLDSKVVNSDCGSSL